MVGGEGKGAGKIRKKRMRDGKKERTKEGRKEGENER